MNNNSANIKSQLVKRYRQEKRFKFYGIFSIFLAMLFLCCLIFSIISKGYSAFYQTELAIPIYFDDKIIAPNGIKNLDKEQIILANYNIILYRSLAQEVGVDYNDNNIKRQLKRFYSNGATATLRNIVLADPNVIGKTMKVKFLASADIDVINKGEVDLSDNEPDRRITNQSIGWLKYLKSKQEAYFVFNKNLFLHAACSRPEDSGLATAILGSLFMMLIVLLLALPLGVAASIYLEEYAPKNKITDFLEININNLAAVPSIIFGLLGLSVFINFLALPRSSSLVGGLVLTLTVLPTIIMVTRASLRAVSPSIKSGALALGASKRQVVFHHCLPLAIPGILTGTIISIAQAMGQTAPLLLIGMVAFVANYPSNIFDPATALPVQIYIWSGEMHRAFVAKTSAAIIILLLFLMCLNIFAILLRRKFEKKG